MTFTNSFGSRAVVAALSFAVLSGLAGCMASEESLDLLDEAPDAAEAAVTSVIRIDQPATIGLEFITDDIGAADGTLCFHDAAGAYRCVATNPASPSLYHSGDIVYASAQPQSCVRSSTGALSQCLDIDITPGDGSTESLGCAEVGGQIVCACTTEVHCDLMRKDYYCAGAVNCNGQTGDKQACTCSGE